MTARRIVADRRVTNIPPLDGIKDPATRKVLEHIKQGWDIRNGGSIVDDEHRFITKADLRQFAATGDISGIGGGVGGVDPSGAVPGGPITDIAKIVRETGDNAINLVRTDPFFIFLGTQIQAFTPNFAKLTKAFTEMQTYVDNQVINFYNADNAVVEILNQAFAGVPGGGFPSYALYTDQLKVLATSASAFGQRLQQLSLRVGQAEITVEQAMSAANSANGTLSAQWYVKIDNNGYVAGFGLISGPNAGNDLPGGVPAGPHQSRFYIRADSFAIGSPGVPRVPIRDQSGVQIGWEDPPDAAVPFIVHTGEPVYNRTTGEKLVDTGQVLLTNANVQYIQSAHIVTGTFDVVQIYTGSTLIDRTSGLALKSCAMQSAEGLANNTAGAIVSTGIRFSGPTGRGDHPGGDNGRIKGTGDVAFTVNCSALVRRYLTIYYRLSGATTTGWIAMAAGSGITGGYSCIATTGLVSSGPWARTSIEFGLACTQPGGALDSGAPGQSDIQFYNMTVMAVNL